FAYLESFFVSNNLERFATTRYNDLRSVWYYVPIVIGGILPWTAFLVVLPWRPLRDLIRRRRTNSDIEWRLLIWAIAPLLLFTASVGKQPRYILPVLPPIAMMLGVAIADRITRSKDIAARRELKTATLLTAALFAAMAVLIYRARPLFVSAHPALTWAGIVALGCAALACIAIVAFRAWKVLPAIMTLSATAMVLTLQFGAFAGRRPEPVEQIAAILQANRHHGEAIGEYETLVRNLMFYTHVRQTPIVDDAGALAFLKSSERVLLVLQR